MRIAANISLLFQELPLLERIGAATRQGFEGVEILFPYDTPTVKLAGALRDAGTPLVLINTPLGAAGEPGFAALAGEQPRFRDGLERALDVARETGCPTVHVMAGRLPNEDSRQTASDVLIDNLRWAAQIARESDVILTLEPLNREDVPGYAYHLPRQVIDLIEQVDELNVRLQFDLYHAARERLPLVDELLACRPWIHHVQIADAPSRGAPDFSKPETRGAVNTLLSWPYTGWLGFEYKP